MAKKFSIIGLKVAELVKNEIAKLDLSEEEIAVAHYYIAKRYFNSLEKALEECGYRVASTEIMNLEFLDEKDRNKTLECLSKVVDTIDKSMKENAIKLKNSIEYMPISNEEREKISREIPEMLLDICVQGRGKEVTDFIVRTSSLCIEDANRLGRSLTDKEISEICDDVKHDRR
jgi:hypothetical protein